MQHSIWAKRLRSDNEHISRVFDTLWVKFFFSNMCLVEDTLVTPHSAIRPVQWSGGGSFHPDSGLMWAPSQPPDPAAWHSDEEHKLHNLQDVTIRVPLTFGKSETMWLNFILFNLCFTCGREPHSHHSCRSETTFRCMQMGTSPCGNWCCTHQLLICCFKYPQKKINSMSPVVWERSSNCARLGWDSELLRACATSFKHDLIDNNGRKVQIWGILTPCAVPTRCKEAVLGDSWSASQCVRVQ